MSERSGILSTMLVAGRGREGGKEEGLGREGGREGSITL